MAKWALSTITSVVYAATFGVVFLFTSIYCLWEVKQEYKQKQAYTHQHQGL